MFQRWAQMTPEEPERFRQGMRGCGPFGPPAADPKADTRACQKLIVRECWYGMGPQVDQSPQSHTTAFHLPGASQNDTAVYVMINAGPNDTIFHIQQQGIWKRVLDTSVASLEDIAEPGHETRIAGLEYLVKGRSVVVLIH